MDWVGIARDGGGWAVAGLLIVAVGRAVDKGSLVLGREYRFLQKEIERIMANFESKVTELEAHQQEERAALSRQVSFLLRANEELRGIRSPEEERTP
jgi:hypothetical protein